MLHDKREAALYEELEVYREALQYSVLQGERRRLYIQCYMGTVSVCLISATQDREVFL